MPDTPLLDKVRVPADTRGFDAAQLRQLARPLGISLDNKRLADPVGNHEGIHISLLSGRLSHIDGRRFDASALGHGS